MAYNTGNPVGSKDPRDLYDNATNFDKYSAGADPFVTDRLGVQRLSIEGMNQSFASAQDGRNSQFETQIAAMGYTWVADYGPGITLTSRNQYFVRDGLAYTVANTTTIPYTTTGNWASEVSNFKAVSVDDILRTDLAKANGVSIIGGAVTMVPTVAALRALPITQASRFAQPVSYSTLGDGGGGPVRRLVLGMPAGSFSDNGYSVIVPTGGDGSAAWVWLTTGPIDIRWCGASTDALIDNAPAIVKAAQNGTTVIIPKGLIFSVSGVMVTGKSDFRVTGGGTLHLMNASNKPVLGATDCTRFSFDRVRIDGNKANQTETVERNNGACLFAYRCSDYWIEKNYAENGYSGAVIVCVDNATDPTELKTNGHVIGNTLINGGVSGGALLCDGIFCNSDNTVIAENIIDGMTDYGIAADYSRNLFIHHNIIKNVAYVHIGAVGAKTWQITNNILDGAGGGIFVTLSGNPATAPYLSDDVLIAGNQIANCVAKNGVAGDGIFVDPSATNIRLDNNEVRNGTRGIAAPGPNIRASNNDVYDMTGRGVFLSGAGSVIIMGKTERCVGGNYFGDTMADKTVVEDAPTSGQTTAVTMLNNWLAYGTPYETAGYRRQLGIVRLRGVVKSGNTGGAPIFTLPVGYRPKTTERWVIPGDSSGGQCVITIDTAGNVIHASGPVAEVHLKNISFAVA